MGLNHEDDRAGCATWIGFYSILSLIFFIIFHDSIGEHPMWFILCVIGVIYFIYVITKGKSNSKQQASNVRSTSSPQVITPNRSNTSLQETSSSNSIFYELNKLIKDYRLPEVQTNLVLVDPLHLSMKTYHSNDVLIKVRKVVALRKNYLNELNSLKIESDNILACPECNSDNIKLSYIKNRENKLREYKTSYQELSSKIQKIHISLLSSGNKAFDCFKSAINEICSSKKAFSQSEVSLQTFIKLKSSIPGDMFVSNSTPIEFNFGAYKFYTLPDVVLAFNKENIFVTAFEPSALHIQFDDKRKNAIMKKDYQNKWTTDDAIISDDSVLLSEGMVRASWLHEKVSGGPDLRYSYNPMFETRSDTYSYTNFSLRIGQYKAVYSLSKGGISKEMQNKVRDYCFIIRGGNTIPSLLTLLEKAALKKEESYLLSEKYEKTYNDMICKITQEAL